MGDGDNPSKKAPDAVDRFVASRIRCRRRELGISQEDLAEKLGLTFQQVQKYERATNRLTVGRLFEIASILQTNVPDLLHGADSIVVLSRYSAESRTHQERQLAGLISRVLAETSMEQQRAVIRSLQSTLETSRAIKKGSFDP